jgi:hypothetical protein
LFEVESRRLGFDAGDEEERHTSTFRRPGPAQGELFGGFPGPTSWNPSRKTERPPT